MTLLSEFIVNDYKLDYSETISEPQRVETRRQNKLALAALQEVRTTSLLICAITSIVNKLSRVGEQSITHDALLAHLPEPPTYMNEIADQMLDADFNSELYAAFREFRLRLEIARTLSLQFCRYPAEVCMKGGVHIDVLSGTWCLLCKAGAALLRRVHAGYQLDLGPEGSMHFFRTIDLLRSCANGHSPCVKSDGSVEVPGFIERRKEERLMVDWSAIAIVAKTAMPAQIVDLSAGGAKFVSLVVLQPSQRTSLRLPSGRTLDGVIAWTNASVNGMRFDRPLASDDPLLSEAAETG